MQNCFPHQSGNRRRRINDVTNWEAERCAACKRANERTLYTRTVCLEANKTKKRCNSIQILHFEEFGHWHYFHDGTWDMPSIRSIHSDERKNILDWIISKMCSVFELRTNIEWANILRADVSRTITFLFNLCSLTVIVSVSCSKRSSLCAVCSKCFFLFFSFVNKMQHSVQLVTGKRENSTFVYVYFVSLFDFKHIRFGAMTTYGKRKKILIEGLGG